MNKARYVAAMVTLLAGGLLATALSGAEARKALKTVTPEYPTLAIKMRVEGTVTLEATVDADGHVQEAKAISGHTLLKETAVECLKKWQFEPAGKSSIETVSINYKLPN